MPPAYDAGHGSTTIPTRFGRYRKHLPLRAALRTACVPVRCRRLHRSVLRAPKTLGTGTDCPRRLLLRSRCARLCGDEQPPAHRRAHGSDACRHLGQRSGGRALADAGSASKRQPSCARAETAAHFSRHPLSDRVAPKAGRPVMVDALFGRTDRQTCECRGSLQRAFLGGPLQVPAPVRYTRCICRDGLCRSEPDPRRNGHAAGGLRPHQRAAAHRTRQT